MKLYLQRRGGGRLVLSLAFQLSSPALLPFLARFGVRSRIRRLEALPSPSVLTRGAQGLAQKGSAHPLISQLQSVDSGQGLRALASILSLVTDWLCDLG